MNTAYVLLRNGFADWEAASASAELRRSFGFSVQTIGLTAEPVLSMGGLRVLPDIILSDFVPASAAILILPGGDAWMQGELVEISEVLREMVAGDRPVAGICAATLALAHAGLLDDRAHTSNGKSFLEKHAPNYRGQTHYRISRAVSDQRVITANGLSPFAFAAEIFRTLAPQQEPDIQVYENLYTRGLLD